MQQKLPNIISPQLSSYSIFLLGNRCFCWIVPLRAQQVFVTGPAEGLQRMPVQAVIPRFFCCVETTLLRSFFLSWKSVFTLEETNDSS